MTSLSIPPPLTNPNIVPSEAFLEVISLVHSI